MSRVIHFELQVDDVERAKEFYEKALGWKIQMAMSKEKGEPMDYWMIMTGEGPGINGGMYNRREAEEKYYTYDCTVLVDNIDVSTQAVKDAGGQITREKQEIPGVGWFVGAKDTEGNRFALMQATEWQPK